MGMVIIFRLSQKLGHHQSFLDLKDMSHILGHISALVLIFSTVTIMSLKVVLMQQHQNYYVPHLETGSDLTIHMYFHNSELSLIPKIQNDHPPFRGMQKIDSPKQDPTRKSLLRTQHS